MFKHLYQLWRHFKIDPEKFWDDEEKLTNEMVRILKQLKDEFDWSNSKYQLLARIRKVASSKTFTVRETKLLRKLVNQQTKEGEADFESVQYYFPGKSLQSLKAKYYEKFDYLKKRKANKA